jgi:hypothetical protein
VAGLFAVKALKVILYPGVALGYHPPNDEPLPTLTTLEMIVLQKLGDRPAIEDQLIFASALEYDPLRIFTKTCVKGDLLGDLLTR